MSPRIYKKIKPLVNQVKEISAIIDLLAQQTAAKFEKINSKVKI
jgi:hypothetical protein